MLCKHKRIESRTHFTPLKYVRTTLIQWQRRLIVINNWKNYGMKFPFEVSVYAFWGRDGTRAIIVVLSPTARGCMKHRGGNSVEASWSAAQVEQLREDFHKKMLIAWNELAGNWIWRAWSSWFWLENLQMELAVKPVGSQFLCEIIWGSV